MPGIHRVDLIGQEVVAEELGVTSQAISNWFARAEESPPDSHLRKLPVPTYIQYRKGKKPMKAWRQAQLKVWVKWHNLHLEQRYQNIPEKQKRGRAA